VINDRPTIDDHDPDHGNGTGRRSWLRSATSALLSRFAFANEHGLTFSGARDLYTTLGYTRDLRFSHYYDRYRRGGIARRIVNLFPSATWASGIEIIEDEDPDVETPFERAVADLFARQDLDLWAKIKRADVLACIGRYSILLVGGDLGDWSTPLPKGLSADRILYVEPYSEEKAKITRLVSDKKDARYGLPEYYEVTTGTDDAAVAAMLSPLGSQGVTSTTTTTTGTSLRVHWSRVIHVTPDPLDNPLLSSPVLEPVWNYLDDLDKNIGGGSEAAWRSMGRKIHANMVGENVRMKPADEAALTDEIEEYIHGMRDFIRTSNIEINPLQPGAVMFGGNASSVAEFVAGTLGVPKRILMGSERGELASDQDRNNFRDNIVTPRRVSFGTPLLLQIVNRFVEHGVLPTPAAKPQVIWPNENRSTRRRRRRSSTPWRGRTTPTSRPGVG
jgi:hypothetical protein